MFILNLIFVKDSHWYIVIVLAY